MDNQIDGLQKAHRCWHIYGSLKCEQKLQACVVLLEMLGFIVLFILVDWIEAGGINIPGGGTASKYNTSLCLRQG